MVVAARTFPEFKLKLGQEFNLNQMIQILIIEDALYLAHKKHVILLKKRSKKLPLRSLQNKVKVVKLTKWVYSSKLIFNVKKPKLNFRSTFGMGTQTVEFPVPANRAGVVIGKGGENIRLIKEKSGAFVQIEKNVGDVDKDPNWKTFIIR